MTSGTKANQGHFGIKAHIGVETAQGLVHKPDDRRLDSANTNFPLR